MREGVDLSGWKIAFYNGNGGATYDTIALTGATTGATDGYAFAAIKKAGIENGDPDGIVLIDTDESVVQFLSYEGTFTATDGAAAGHASTDIGVSQSWTTASATTSCSTPSSPSSTSTAPPRYRSSRAAMTSAPSTS